MPSSITEEDVLKLRDARYLTYEILHRLPAQGQVIPTPEPGESVVFVPHLCRGLGFPMDPFMRGLLFYYGLEFHDLAPESILHISSFIVVCEAFLRTTPHFGLWLKTFNVEPKMIAGRQAECGGAVGSGVHPPHLIIHCRLRSLPPHFPSLWLVAQNLQRGAEDD